MHPPFFQFWSEKAGWFFDQPGKTAWFISILTIPVAYYLIALALTRPRKKKIPMVLFSPPRGLSPASLRYIRLRECDSRGVIVCLINAAVKRCYHIRWFRSGFLATREPFGDCESLSSAEKQALSFSNNQYWDKVVISKTTSVRTRKMQSRLHSFLKKRHKNLFKMHLGLILGGMALTIGLLTGFLMMYGHGKMSAFAAVEIIAALMFLFLPAFFFWVSIQDRYWFGMVFSTLVFAFGIVAVVAFEADREMPLFSLLLFPLLIVQLFFIRMIPTWTAEGHQVNDEITAYRNYLEKKVNAIQNDGATFRITEQELPYLMALDLDKKLGPYFRQLLCQTQYGPFATLEKLASRS
jgi:Predicted membrane protein (DUF2207)